MISMSRGIPTGKTYLGFAALWHAIFFGVWIVCIAFFATGNIVTATALILLSAYGFFRHARAIGRRGKQGIRRPTPELRRWLSITSASLDVIDSNSR